MPQFLIEIVNSPRDASGNTYFGAMVTANVGYYGQREYMRFNIDAPSNVKRELTELFGSRECLNEKVFIVEYQISAHQFAHDYRSTLPLINSVKRWKQALNMVTAKRIADAFLGDTHDWIAD